MTKTSKEILVEARALINKGWVQGTAARNEHREAVHELSKEAVCFCILGALHHAAEISFMDGMHPNTTFSGGVYVQLFEAKKAIAQNLAGAPDILSFNDHPGTTKEKVLALFDRALGSI